MITGEIKNAGERVEDLIKMGRTLGFSPIEWTVLLQFAVDQMKSRFDVRIESMGTITNECDCENCVKTRALLKKDHRNFSVVRDEPKPGGEA